MDRISDLSKSFYQQIAGFSAFHEFTHHEYYTEVPEDWYVVITDVTGSTSAISEGRYKQVNALGVASIVAVLNAVKPFSIPYVFGGDGATFCIPPELRTTVESALMAACEMATSQFQLSLRAGIVPISDILEAGQKVMVAKYQPSPFYEQAMFTCSGLSYAEGLIKSTDPDNPYLLRRDAIKPNGSFEGFECRWNEIPSPGEESVSILVQAVTKDEEKQAVIYSQVYRKIIEIYGSEQHFNPIRKELLSLTVSPRKLLTEVHIRVVANRWGKRAHYLVKLLFQVLAGKWLMWRRINTKSVNWGRYKEILIANTDYRKFDEMLRMVISGSVQQRRELEKYLAGLNTDGVIVYGMHSADKSLITCLVFNYENEHVHFLDGANGGYAMASVQLKRQLKQMKSGEK